MYESSCNPCARAGCVSVVGGKASRRMNPGPKRDLLPHMRLERLYCVVVPRKAKGVRS